MHYQQISINQEKLPFIKENYQEQIKALELFFDDAFPKSLPKECWDYTLTTGYLGEGIDFVDENVGMLKASFKKRLKTYKQMGYHEEQNGNSLFNLN